VGRTWGRLYADTRNHRKIKVLRHLYPDAWWVIYPLFELSFQIDDGGWIYISPGFPYPLEDLAAEVYLPAERLKEILNFLASPQIGMIIWDDRGVQIKSYEERNFPSDISTARVRAHRAAAREKALKKKAKRHRESETFQERPMKRLERKKDRKIDVVVNKLTTTLSEVGAKNDDAKKTILTPRGLIDLYNEVWPMPNMKRPAQATKGRLDKAKVRLEFNPTRKYWIEVFQKVQANPFLNGTGKPWNGGRGADLDWLLHNDQNHSKVWEGRFEQGNGTGPGSGPGKPGSGKYAGIGETIRSE
jgi:hypothetical protein